MWQVADLEMSALHHHVLYICVCVCVCVCVCDCCSLPLGNMPSRMPVAASLIYSIIVVIPI